jgi:pimeloyl-ACP methyl ester carboxylesterase
MKNLLKIIAFGLILLPFPTQAQENWVAYSQKIETKGYEGHRFRWQGAVRAEIEDDSAWAGLWVRADKQKGVGFFNNMQDRPIRNRTWQTYTVEGKIDTGVYQLAFGALSIYNGKFYIDDVKLEIETEKNAWKTVFSADFEDNNNSLVQGIQRWGLGSNLLYKAEIQKGQAAQGNNCLLIEGKNVPNYGNNNKVGKYADVNGIKLYYEIYGQGQPLVVLHGNGGSIDNAAPHYAELIKKYKVIAIDNRAQGHSTDTDKPLTYDLMASDVNALLDQLGIDSVNVWGQSDGAILGLLLALDYPKKVKRVLAFGANMQPDSLAIFPWAINYIAKKAKTAKDEKERKLNVLMLDYPNVPYSKLAQIKAPVLIMVGDRDAIRPEHALKLFQSIPNSHLCIIPGATHGASWEKRELFMQLLNDFFEKPFEMPTTEDWLKD